MRTDLRKQKSRPDAPGFARFTFLHRIVLARPNYSYYEQFMTGTNQAITVDVGHRGPNPGIVAAVFMAVFIAGLIPVTLLAGDTHFPAPQQPAEEIIAYFRDHPDKVRLCAFLQFGSAVPLGIFTATMVSRLRFHGIKAAGTHIALFGGIAATMAVSIAAMVCWVLAQPGIAEETTVTRALHYLTFAVGGPGYSVPLGLLIAGISVTGAFAKLLPKWLVIFGLILGAAGVLSTLSLIIPQALFLIPLTRFPGFVWLIAAGFTLPRGRRRKQ
jgi:hypothetical protein